MPAYGRSQRETPGSIETLPWLRENGYRLVIVNHGQREDQVVKSEAIVVAHLIDHIVTSGEAGYAKPNPRIFRQALALVGASPATAYVVGGPIDSDVKGIRNAGLVAVLYSPIAQDSQQFVLRHRFRSFVM